MAERKFLSSVEALGLHTTTERAMPQQEVFGGNVAPNFGGVFGALSSPLFRYGNRILSALAATPDRRLEVSALMTDLQKQLGSNFNTLEFLGVVNELQSAGALTFDGRICILSDRGLAMAS